VEKVLRLHGILRRLDEHELTHGAARGEGAI
jgi:hypothetical protein